MRAVKNFLRYYETIRHLRLKQIFYFAVKPIRAKIARYHFSSKPSIPEPRKLKLQPFLHSEHSLSENAFTFLNLEKFFQDGKPDWNFREYGLLWNYNLNYFDYLNQENLNVESGLNLIHHFIDNAVPVSPSYDPYPVSLRGINWIKFLVKNHIAESRINDSLFRQYVKLSYEIERHLGANHLIENGFSLLFAAYYFNDGKFLSAAEKILIRELNEQILNDGAHFELSSMYHRIILYRILDCINLVKNNAEEHITLLKLLEEKASVMLCWMNKMTFLNGKMPHFNDSTLGIAPDPEQLIFYAKKLDIKPRNLALSESGYRKFSFPKYELILDTGDIIPSYNPGHAHAGMLSFCLNVSNRPVIVDCGTSTYENNERRKYERSTAAHNTVSVDGLEQSDMWSSFRVGRRAKITEVRSTENSCSAMLKGFTSAGIRHKREWEFSENRIIIKDLLDGKHLCKAFLHFHPKINVEQAEGSISGDNFSITFKNHSKISLDNYDYAEGFNRLVKAKVAVVLFSGRLQTEIAL